MKLYKFIDEYGRESLRPLSGSTDMIVFHHCTDGFISITLEAFDNKYNIIFRLHGINVEIV